jgi:hypothetical protein
MDEPRSGELLEGKRTVLLRDGRCLNENDFTDKPSLFDLPPF